MTHLVKHGPPYDKLFFNGPVTFFFENNQRDRDRPIKQKFLRVAYVLPIDSNIGWSACRMKVVYKVVNNEEALRAHRRVVPVVT